MVCAGHPLASQAGIAMLQKGGNAVDAAIATAAALNVVEPLMSGIGGDGYLMIYWKNDDRLSVVNATGAAPGAATREHFLSPRDTDERHFIGLGAGIGGRLAFCPREVWSPFARRSFCSSHGSCNQRLSHESCVSQSDSRRSTHL